MKIKTQYRLLKKAQAYKRIVAYRIFNDYCYDGDLDKICCQIRKYRGVLEALLNIVEQQEMGQILPRRSRRAIKSRKWFKSTCRDRLDPRKGDDTYGYKSIEDIELDLSYISDRFLAPFRLRWLLEVPEKVDQLKELNK